VNIELPYLEIAAKTAELFTGQSLHHKVIRILQPLPCKYPIEIFSLFLAAKLVTVKLITAAVLIVRRETTLQRTSTENMKKIFPEKELRSHSPSFHIHVSVSGLYIPDLPILLQEICGVWTDPGNTVYSMNRSQTHECGN
jgi:hypothetical protein